MKDTVVAPHAAIGHSKARSKEDGECEEVTHPTTVVVGVCK